MYTLNILPPSANSMCVRILLRAAKFPFEEIDVYGKTREEAYIAKCPAHHAPLLESAELPKGCLPDSVAIMQYLCDRHELEQWYPTSLTQRAMINACLQYQAGALYPMVAKVVYPLFGFPPYPADLHGAPIPDSVKTEGRLAAQAALPELLSVIHEFFFEGDFIGGKTPGIADLRFASTLEWLPVAAYEFPSWARDYLHRMESELGEHYAQPAADLRALVQFTLDQTSGSANVAH